MGNKMDNGMVHCWEELLVCWLERKLDEGMVEPSVLQWEAA